MIILASTAVYAVDGVLNLKNRSYTSPTTSSETSVHKQTSSYSLDNPTKSTAEQQSDPINCNDISVAAEAKLLNATSALVYPQYGDSRAIFDEYNNSYRAAYNTYLNSIKSHNCPVNIADKGTIQYGSPSCTQAYSDKLVAVLRNQIYSGVTLDMAEYKRWEVAGLPKTEQQIAIEQNYIQNKNNSRVQGYVSKTNESLVKIYCPTLNLLDFYTHMF